MGRSLIGVKPRSGQRISASAASVVKILNVDCALFTSGRRSSGQLFAVEDLLELLGEHHVALDAQLARDASIAAAFAFVAALGALVLMMRLDAGAMSSSVSGEALVSLLLAASL